MGEKTKIEWTATYLDDGTVIPGNTFNPWIGCTKVSDGCKFCYAENLMDHRWGKVQWGPQGTRVRTSAEMWTQPIKWNEKAKREGHRAKVFCASLADVFEDRAELVPWRFELFELIDRTPHLDWLLLTKRPENIQRLWPFAWYDAQCTWPNVWLGTSVENQEMADKRIPHLLKVPSAVRFLSMEPLLGPVDIWQYTVPRFAADDPRHYPWRDGIDWVIVGGESGPNARPMHPDWARKLRDQCANHGTAYFFKQWGEYIPRLQLTSKQIADLPNSVYVNAKPIDGDQVYRVGKKAAGRLLDGREWNEFPVAVTA